MSDLYSIRTAIAADIEPMRALERRAAQKFRAVGYDFCSDGPVRDFEEHERVLLSGATFVAENSSLAGFAMFEPLDAEAHLIEIDVDPVHQGHGLGRRLIDAGAGWARSRCLEAITLTTYRDVQWNAPYYARLGFAAFEPGPDRPGLLAIIQKEKDCGFAFAPRIAMRKTL